MRALGVFSWDDARKSAALDHNGPVRVEGSDQPCVLGARFGVPDAKTLATRPLNSSAAKCLLSSASK